MHTTPLAFGEISSGEFLLITVGYVIGGILCIILAATGFGTQGRSRILSGVVGAACLIYALYLMLGDAQTVFVSFYIMALPVILLIRAIVVFAQRRNPKAAQPVNAATSWPPAQPGQQPNAGWPQQAPPYQGQPQQGQPFPGQQQYPQQPQGQPFPGQQAPQQPQQAWPAQQSDPTAPAPVANTFPTQQQPYPPNPPQGR